jgi:DNA-directed RNA polymerase specialized sigma54-like protein
MPFASVGTKRIPYEVVEMQFRYTKLFRKFTRKHYEKNNARLIWTKTDRRDAIDKLCTLNPKPQRFQQSLQSCRNHCADFILEVNDGQLAAYLTKGNVPDLKISRHYANCSVDSENRKNQSRPKGRGNVCKTKTRFAKWFIDAICSGTKRAALP